MIGTARRASAEDLPTIEWLAEVAVDEQREARGGDLWSTRDVRPAPVAPAIGALLGEDRCAVFAGTIDDVVVGYAVVELEVLRDDRTLGVVTDIFVLEPARAVGVGAALMELVLAFCDDAGCMGVDGRALPGNRLTKNFFESWGFTARAIVVHRKAAAPDES